jgi:hypothetical protein
MKAVHLIKTFLMLVLVASITVGCKNSGGGTPTKTKSQLLSVKWDIVSGTANGVPIPNIASSGLTVTFTNTAGTTNGTYVLNRGTATFSPSLAPSGSGSWSLDAAGSTLTLDNTRILSIDVNENNLVITWKATAAEDKTLPNISLTFIRK